MQSGTNIDPETKYWSNLHVDLIENESENHQSCQDPSISSSRVVDKEKFR